jgi:hypothetical protein
MCHFTAISLVLVRHPVDGLGDLAEEAIELRGFLGLLSHLDILVLEPLQNRDPQHVRAVGGASIQDTQGKRTSETQGCRTRKTGKGLGFRV